MKPEEILTSSLDDLVFEKKNKAYGAYFLRQKYQKHITMALLISVAIFLFGFSTPFIAALLTPEEKPLDAKKILITELSEPPPIDKNTPPPPPPDLPPPPPKTVKFTPPVIKPDEEVKEEDVPPTVEEAKEEVISTETAIDPNANVNFNEAPVVEEAPQPKIWMYVEQQPVFPGGDKALLEYLSNNLRYPAAARENGIEGRVMLKFVVNENGEISDIEVLRDIGGGCAEEAKRVVKNMPKWNPGKQNGNPVKVYFNLPVTFRLNSQ